MTRRTEELRKSQVSLPPPGGNVRWAMLGGDNNIPDLELPDKRQQLSIYYEMYRQHPVVRAAIDKKAQYAAAGGFVFKPLDPSLGEVPKYKVDALTRFFRRSNGRALVRLTYKDLDIYGESFWLIIRSIADARTPMKAMRLNPRYMRPVVQNRRIIKWKYGPIGGTEIDEEYNDEVILHFKIDDPENDVQGISPLHALQRAVAQDIYSMEYNEAFFRNSAQTGTIFVVKTSSEEEARRNRQWIEENYVGAENAHRPLLIEGEVSVEKTVSNSQEMEFLQGRMFLRQEIAMVLEVDLEKLGVHESSNRSVAREVDDAFHSESVWPRQQIVEEEINNKLIQSIFGWSDVVFDQLDKDPRATADQADVDNKNLNSGREDINTQRKRLGLPPVEGGDEAFIMTPMGPWFVRNFKAMAELQVKQMQLGANPPPPAANEEPLTRRQAEDVSQKE